MTNPASTQPDCPNIFHLWTAYPWRFNTRVDAFIKTDTSNLVLEVGGKRFYFEQVPASTIKAILSDEEWLSGWQMEVPEHHPTLKAWIENEEPDRIPPAHSR